MEEFLTKPTSIELFDKEGNGLTPLALSWYNPASLKKKRKSEIYKFPFFFCLSFPSHFFL
jgi:hypothetical protein